MVDSKILEISTGTIIKDPEMLGVVPDQFKIKKCVYMQLKSFPS